MAWCLDEGSWKFWGPPVVSIPKEQDQRPCHFVVMELKLSYYRGIIVLIQGLYRIYHVLAAQVVV